ncbi:MAG TPA: cation-translocating P-type ATPase [Candidatus Limnocylindrales bacterium]|nr:cation-translocating P-type ATPase [Candidatus Limnocylindrales bacterium]
MLSDLETKSDVRAPHSSSERMLTELSINGMTCGNCVRHVTEAIQAVPGVSAAQVSLETQRATVKWDLTARPDVDSVIKAVQAEGFEAKQLETAAPDLGATKMAGWQLNLWVGLPITAILMIGEWVLQWGMLPAFQWVSFGLATLVQVLAGGRFYRGAWRQLKVGSSNMDTLVALGSTTAFVYSLWTLFSGHSGHLYFMEAAAIITLISLGHWVESRVSLRASSALRKLLQLTPALARRRSDDGSEVEVPVAELDIGDIVVLRPGDRIPTDGTVSEGESAVDESMLTGESIPVEKTLHGLVYAGTLNLNGRLFMRVSAVGETTALAHIIAAVQRAQNSRANIQRLGDRVSSVFVPVVVACALLAGLWWGLAPASARLVHDWLAQFLIGLPSPPTGAVAAGFIVAAAVLIIACPCAMGLATPAAIMAGSNAAAQRGILIRDGIALEKAGRITGVIFDKTGTLTQGKPSVVMVWTPETILNLEASSPASGANKSSESQPHNPVVELAAALASHSLHPFSRAIAKLPYAESKFVDWRELQGSGLEAKIVQSLNSEVGTDATRPVEMVRLGSLRWLKESAVNLDPGNAFIQDRSAQGITLVGLAAGSRLLGLFAIKDIVKPGAAAVIAELHRQSLSTYLVTGDNSVTATAIGRELGIKPENVFAEVRPEQKAVFVKNLQQRGERLAFVGDGINDAPALEQADLGIAISRASDIAREAADIILLKSEIEAVPESLGLARATLRTIKQNLFWAFFYNSVGIPLAALGFMSPILCAAAMGLSDLVVIGNALRLRQWRLRK